MGMHENYGSAPGYGYEADTDIYEASAISLDIPRMLHMVYNSCVSRANWAERSHKDKRSMPASEGLTTFDVRAIDSTIPRW
jgi:hypothetical protein